MKTLYLRIYLTVVSVLLVFALIAGWIAQNKLEHEHAKMQAQTAERATAWATLIENSLPGANADPDSQRAALLSWSDRLHVPMALDAVDGHRIATSPLMAGHESPNDPEGRLMRLPLSDGRMLWVWRPSHGPHPEPPTEHGWSLLIPPPWLMGEGLVATLVILFAAIAAGAWPVVRRLTLRLEKLKRGVEQFGAGQLGTRIVIDGKDEVALVAQSFNAAAARIEELIRANKSLLANASHELRSPLARLKMALSMLPDADAAHLDGLQEEIHRDIAELDSLVEEVLLASRLEAGSSMGDTFAVELLALGAEEAARAEASFEPETDAADDAGAHPDDPELMHIDAEGCNDESAAPAQRRDGARLAGTRALEPAAPDRCGDAEQHEEQGEHPAHAGNAPVAGRGEQLLHERHVRTGLTLGDADRARQRQPEHREAVGHADAQMYAERSRRHQPAIEAGFRNSMFAIKDSRSGTGYGAGSFSSSHSSLP